MKRAFWGASYLAGATEGSFPFPLEMLFLLTCTALRGEERERDSSAPCFGSLHHPLSL